jgi:hypothetical protein
MPKKRPQPERPATQPGAATTKAILPIPRRSALSFLKDTKGALTWSAGVTDLLEVASDAWQVALHVNAADPTSHKSVAEPSRIQTPSPKTGRYLTHGDCAFWRF